MEAGTRSEVKAFIKKRTGNRKRGNRKITGTEGGRNKGYGYAGWTQLFLSEIFLLYAA